MDILGHALAGACTGAAFGRPFTGAILAVLPDLPLVGHRREVPTGLYNYTHSIAFVFMFSWLALIFFNVSFLLAALCIGSHILLDLFTHGKQWAPTLMWPSRKRFCFGKEWEFFNVWWFIGVGLTIIWSVVWLSVLKINGQL